MMKIKWQVIYNQHLIILLIFLGGLGYYLFLCGQEVVYFDVNSWKEKRSIEYLGISLKSEVKETENSRFLEKLDMVKIPPDWKKEYSRSISGPFSRCKPYSRSNDAHSIILFMKLYSDSRSIPLETQKKIILWEKHRMKNFYFIRKDYSKRFIWEEEKWVDQFLQKIENCQNVHELNIEDILKNVTD